MRTLLGLLALTFSNVTFAQDPTVPSAQILERLQQDRSSTIVAPPDSPPTQGKLPQPSLKLRAVVMSDSDHGAALIEVDGRRLRLRLSREAAEQFVASGSSRLSDVDGVVIQDSTYHVLSFSSHSIVLSNGSQRFLVQ